MLVCMAAGCSGTGYVLGDNRIGMDPEGFAEAKLIVLWGANPLVTRPHLWRHVKAPRRRGARLVVIDPLRTRTADEADAHLAPRPGTDAALALGVLYVVLARGAQDTAFIAQRTVGWEPFRSRILEF